jgi:hypothetical protein
MYNKDFVQCFFTSFFGSGEWSESLIDITKGLDPDILSEAWVRALGTLDGLIAVGNPAKAELCFDVPGGALYNGNQLGISPCQDSNPSQQFFMENNSFFWAPTALVGMPGMFKPMCVDVDGGKGIEGANIVINPCTGQIQQQWVWDAHGYIRWLPNSTLCLHLMNGVSGS